MANTTVTDALFVANVAKVNVMENSKKIQAESVTFKQAYGDATGKISNQIEYPKAQPVSGGASVENKNNPVKEDKSSLQNGSQASKSEKQEVAAKETVKKSDEIKGNIKEKMGVTDEDIENAMETLGLMNQDLLNPNALKDLLMELSGTEDSLELLTNAELYEGMQDIIEDVNAAAELIIEAAGITEDDFAELIDDKGLFSKVINNLEDVSGRQTFGPIEENVASQAEESGIAPDDGKKSDGNGKAGVEVLVTKTGNDDLSGKSKTETFRNITQTEKTELNNDNNMAGVIRQETVTVNSLGEVVETIESFATSSFDGEDVFSQVTETIKLNFSEDITSMEMQLHPASLGTVNMQISSQNGVVTAHLLVQNEAVKAALESQLVQLQETFEEQGKTVEAVEVSVANYDLNRGMQQNANEQEREQALRSGRIARRRLRLDDFDEGQEENLSEEEQIAADMMRREGNSLDFMA